MSRQIIYIINPISGTRTKKDLQQLIEKKTTEQNIPFQIFPSVASGDYSFLHPVIKEHKITDVVIAGGDGTVSQVVSSLMNCDLNFGIIPCGSGNGLAYAAKIPKDPLKALDVVFNGHAVAIDGFNINEQFACMLCGLGFDAKVAHDFAQQPTRGLTTYVKQVARNFFAAKTYSFELTVNDKVFMADAYFISIANSNQFGNNFTIAPKASLSDGLLDIVIVTNQSKLSLLLQTLKQIRGKNKLETETIEENKKGVIYFQTDKLSIINITQAPLHIDGDPAETPATLKIEIMKKCFRLIQP
ncbi:MAG: YegS/Rv2252/BmrU family lipid kinase [Chitinophagaceae bacterium]|jgi:YegS/Rv2252/BmrU family lipid kinase|nr:YegS/Rv2252/BmrU family lipid kinase [Chitinophagaceae bacterium]MBK7679963.1 YegS/Rv2252/BmrU family lipid kinase [Chitinophagaceae bacterium]MBK9465649.1 YegS/Rv2252/BmrU family lipid kinase [Chitinophagaceae bacterium]MBK9660599.1 YegS/Rv2252/BmrU family lipid kinase [Chitinophagaceae bacterium]MBK9937670.1 YegS/Rv2252/BmrU family lipid kinase [Chitinophagaceae bacterium]